ncbi:MAG: dTDP-4-dehydrorhamnose 3,5-epimerase family protein, partial [Cellulomonadaceae bacterium]|nr:dTDP-4-dehydrorhamnose 3,5-epimerase family protein [Cellulomonadaceae bacterium]
MKVRELSIPGAFEFSPKLLGDPRGLFLEAFKAPVFEETLGQRF